MDWTKGSARAGGQDRSIPFDVCPNLGAAGKRPALDKASGRYHPSSGHPDDIFGTQRAARGVPGLPTPSNACYQGGGFGSTSRTKRRTAPTSTDGATLDGRIPTPCQGDHEGSYAGEGAGLSTATGGYRGSSRSGSADRGADARGVIWALCAPRRKLKEPPKKSLSSGQIPDRLACRTWESPPSDTL